MSRKNHKIIYVDDKDQKEKKYNVINELPHRHAFKYTNVNYQSSKN